MEVAIFIEKTLAFVVVAACCIYGLNKLIQNRKKIRININIALIIIVLVSYYVYIHTHFDKIYFKELEPHKYAEDNADGVGPKFKNILKKSLYDSAKKAKDIMLREEEGQNLEKIYYNNETRKWIWLDLADSIRRYKNKDPIAVYLKLRKELNLTMKEVNGDLEKLIRRQIEEETVDEIIN